MLRRFPAASGQMPRRRRCGPAGGNGNLRRSPGAARGPFTPHARLSPDGRENAAAVVPVQHFMLAAKPYVQRSFRVSRPSWVNAPLRPELLCCETHHQTARRQPQRNRHPRLPLGPRTGHPHGRHLLARRPLRPAPLQGRRSVPGRQAGRADPGVPEHPRHHRASPRSTASMPSTRATASCRRTRSWPGPATEAGITFVGPHVEALEQLGDKTVARNIAEKADVPVLGGSDAIASTAEGQKLAAKLGYPVILKAANGGGGRGMRVVHKPKEFAAAFEQAQRESLPPSAAPTCSSRSSSRTASHIEVQLLGDKHGNLVHLFERDCSVQRRHQKVVEIAPAPNLDPTCGSDICDAALEIGRAVKYENAGTVEFLVDRDTNKFYFIEVNPRIQVEHTVTEEVTGIDIVR